jgi:sugar phosphate isomerase/epimerase
MPDNAPKPPEGLREQPSQPPQSPGAAPSSPNAPPPPEGQRRERPQQPVFTVAKVKEFAATFNRIGEACRKAGLGFAYHNHRNEFQPVEEGGIMYDILLKETDPALVDFELDLGWAVAAGADPLALFDKYPGRFKLLHVKDMNAENQSVVVGQGKIDFAAIFAQSEKAGAQFYIVEYEGHEDPMESVKASATFLKNMTY